MVSSSDEIIYAYRYHQFLALDASQEEPQGEPRLPPRPRSPLRLKLKDQLTLAHFGPNAPYGKDCPNSKLRADMWLTELDGLIAGNGVGFLT